MAEGYDDVVLHCEVGSHLIPLTHVIYYFSKSNPTPQLKPLSFVAVKAYNFPPTTLMICDKIRWKKAAPNHEITSTFRT